MASISNSKTLFFFTSPRTPHKIINEIKLLVENLSGKVWNTETQKKYASLLAKEEFFEGKIKENDDFGARDRINRAPKALGFVDLDPIGITKIGKRILSEKRNYETFTRQFMKFQLPSPYHIDKTDRYCVKPYLEFLRLIYDLNGITKHELAMFGMQLINIRLYEDIVKQIIKFRKEKDTKKYTKKREFIFNSYDAILRKIYAEEIKNNNFKLRESDSDQGDLTTFLYTKKRNLIDYADAAIRYLKATELISFNVRSMKITIIEDRRKDVEFLLRNIEREPTKFASENEFKEYLFDDSNITLLTDNKKELSYKIKDISKDLIQESVIEKEPAIAPLDIEGLKDKYEELHTLKIGSLIKKEQTNLKSYHEFDDILRIYNEILEGDVADPSLIFEWNTWRVMAMLDDGEIIGNFKIDTDGSPLFTAPANIPDINCDYKEFGMIVEVTLSKGLKQYEIEGEPVARHLGKYSKEKKKDIFCLFVAGTVSEATLAHFFALHKINISYYGGKSKIIPIDVQILVNILKHAKDKGGIKSSELYAYMNYLSKKATEINNEEQWFDIIKRTSSNWTEIGV